MAGIKIKHISKVSYSVGTGREGGLWNTGDKTCCFAMALSKLVTVPGPAPRPWPPLALCSQGPVWRLRVESVTRATAQT